jgi:signal transduction histidine kinase
LNPPWLQLGLQPFDGMQVAAFVLALIAALNLAIWWRDGDEGLAWFGAGVALLALWGATHDQHTVQGAHVRTDHGWQLVVQAGIGAILVGLVQYVGVPKERRTAVLALLLAPLALAIATTSFALLTDAQVSRHVPRLLLSLSLVGMAGLAWWARGREPGAGHSAIAFAALSIPLLSIGLALAGVQGSVRYWGALAILLLALTLLTVPLLRRRRALEAEVQRRRTSEAALQQLNGSLEEQVARRTEEQREMIDALESFNRSVSHDLRGPLGGIAELARIAHAKLEAGDAEMARRSLPAIAAQTQTLARTVEALLELARVSEAPLKREPLPLEPLVREAMALVQSSAAEPLPPVEIAALPPVQADAALVRVALVNLIGNAVKFTRGRDDARVAVSARQVNGHIAVTVSDNGPGFEPHAAQRLFEPFTRLQPDTHEGHGIGLSIVRRAIARMGGRVWAEGRPGAGASFHFTLPAA